MYAAADAVPLAELEETELAVVDAAAETDAGLLAETDADLDALELELTGLLELAGLDVLAALVVPALLDVVVWWLELLLEETFLLLSGAVTARPPQWRLCALCVKSCASVLRFAAAHVARKSHGRRLVVSFIAVV